MYLEKSVAVVVPAYKEESQIADVITKMPAFVDHIVVVDDASPEPDRTCEIVESLRSEYPSVDLVAREKNGGVGAAIESGYQRALELDADITCVMAGDGQMDPADLHRIVHPVATGQADYAKANRLTLEYSWQSIPRTRLIGNMLLSFLTRFATGYWTIGDAQTGYTAGTSQLIAQFVKRGIYPRYGVPNDLLISCALFGARVVDIPTAPRYNVGEQSKLRPGRVALPIAFLLMKGFFRRMFVRYFVVEANPVPLAYLAGFVSFLVGTTWSTILVVRAIRGATTTIEVVTASLLFVGGSILIVLAVVLDVLFSIAGGRRSAESAAAEPPADQDLGL